MYLYSVLFRRVGGRQNCTCTADCLDGWEGDRTVLVQTGGRETELYLYSVLFRRVGGRQNCTCPACCLDGWEGDRTVLVQRVV